MRRLSIKGVVVLALLGAVLSFTTVTATAATQKSAHKTTTALVAVVQNGHWTVLGGLPLRLNGAETPSEAHAVVNSTAGIAAMHHGKLSQIEIAAVRKTVFHDCTIPFNQLFLSMSFGPTGQNTDFNVRLQDPRYKSGAPGQCSKAAVYNVAGKLVEYLDVKLPAKCANIGVTGRTPVTPPKPPVRKPNHPKTPKKVVPKPVTPPVVTPPVVTPPVTPPVVVPPVVTPPVAPPATTPTSSLTCDSVGIPVVSGNTVTVLVNFTPTNVTFASAISTWASGVTSTVTTSTGNIVTVGHTYPGPGTYTFSVTINGTKPDGSPISATSTACTGTITIPQTPKYSCVSPLGLSRVDPNTNSYTAVGTYAASGGATYGSSTFDYGDGSPVAPGTLGAVANTIVGSHTYTVSGTYIVSLMITFNLPSGSSTPTATVTCTGKVTVQICKPPVVKPCPPPTKPVCDHGDKSKSYSPSKNL